MAAMGPPTGASRALAAYIRFASGDLERSAAALDLVRVHEIAEDTAYGIVVALWSEVAAAIGADAQCRSLAKALEPLSSLHLLTGGIYCGAADRLRALLLERLGEHDQADALFADAVRQHEDLRSPTWVARTELDWAEALLRRGDREAAQAHLDLATAVLGDLDLPANQLRLAEFRTRLATG